MLTERVKKRYERTVINTRSRQVVVDESVNVTPNPSIYGDVYEYALIATATTEASDMLSRYEVEALTEQLKYRTRSILFAAMHDLAQEAMFAHEAGNNDEVYRLLIELLSFTSGKASLAETSNAMGEKQ